MNAAEHRSRGRNESLSRCRPRRQVGAAHELYRDGGQSRDPAARGRLHVRARGAPGSRRRADDGVPQALQLRPPPPARDGGGAPRARRPSGRSSARSACTSGSTPSTAAGCARASPRCASRRCTSTTCRTSACGPRSRSCCAPSDTAELVTGVYGVVRPALVRRDARAPRGHEPALRPPDLPPAARDRARAGGDDRVGRGGARRADAPSRGVAARAAPSPATSSATSPPPAASRAATPWAPRSCRRRAGTAATTRWMPSRSATRASSTASTARRRSTTSTPTSRGRRTSAPTRSCTSACARWTCPSGWRRSSSRRRGRPWEYYRELGRQLWDETRHAMMGEVALHAAGVPFYEYPIDMAASASLNCEFTPLEAHILLWDIEQGLMPRETGKRWEWTIARPRRRPAARRAAGLRLGRRGAARADRPSLAGRRARHRRRAQGRRRRRSGSAGTRRSSATAGPRRRTSGGRTSSRGRARAARSGLDASGTQPASASSTPGP